MRLAILLLALALPAAAPAQEQRAPVVSISVQSRQPPGLGFRGQGAGLIISADGYILTVTDIDGRYADYRVRLADAREFPARVVGVDWRTRVALLKVDAASLPVAKIGDPGALVPGEIVVAVGETRASPTATAAGAVRMKERWMKNDYASNLVPYIETSVGLIDGPLFNARGEVVGLNYMAAEKPPERAFAVPINLAMAIQQELREHGKVRRARLGISVNDVEPSKGAGALVAEVEKGGAAERAGMNLSDVIVDIDGKPVRDADAATRLVASYKPGAKVDVRVLRGAAPVMLGVTLDEYVDESRATRKP